MMGRNPSLGIAPTPKPVKVIPKDPKVPCRTGQHRLRFVALYPDGRPDAWAGRWCELCPYRDTSVLHFA